MKGWFKEMSSDNARENLVSGDIVKTMLSLSIPAILGMVVIGLYNFMDAVFVGRMVGPEAMTAVKVAYPFTLLNSGMQIKYLSYRTVR
jgi:Na+-driven multidrug efflux pump